MPHLAITLVCFLTAFTFSGCAQKEPCIDQFVNIPQKCDISAGEMPTIEQRKFEKGQELEQAKWAYKNYLIMKEYATKLMIEIERCK